MASTDFGALSAAQKKVWSEKTWRQGRDKSFWLSSGMIGKGTDDTTKPIHLVTELTATARGDRCVMQLVADLAGDGVAGDNELDGNEEPLVNDSQEIVIDLFRNGAKSKGKMSLQRTVIRFRAQARDKLSFWLADRLDDLCHLTIAGRAYTLNVNGSTRPAGSQLPQLAFASSVTAASANRIMFASTATSEATLTTAMTMNWNLIVQAKAAAARKKIQPIRDGGREYYAVVMSTEQARDLKQDATYQTNVGRAALRGSSNPLFKGTFAVIDDVMLYEHNKVFNTLGLASASKWGSGGTVDGAQASVIGSQALGFARIGEPTFEESTLTDYGNREGIGYGRMIGLLKPVFRTPPTEGTGSEDYGVIALKTAAAKTL